MKPIIISLFETHPVMASIAAELNCEIAKVRLHNFPDGETHIKFEAPLQDKEVIILTSLDLPNQKILPLLFVAETARKIGAKKVGLCAPYLAYMRQDKQFQPGEGITSDYFAALLSHYFDFLVTIDPHLHRHHNLNEIYSIPNTVLHAAPQIAQWITKEITNPILIGPDSESEQWVSKVAQSVTAPYLISEKIRHGDHNVDISLPEIQPYLSHTPVLIDDIISTAHTMIKTVKLLKAAGLRPPVCIGVHAVFAANAYEALLQSGPAQVVTCNSIPHPSNQIDLSELLRQGIQQELSKIPR